MKNRQRKIIENVKMLEAVAEGNCIAKIDDKVLFVPFTAPDDVVDVEVVRQKHNYMEGRVLRLVEPSLLRVEPKCSHYGICGGCKWQHLDYASQLSFKEKQVRDQLERIGKITLPVSEPILGSPEIYYYRNKLEYTFAPRKWFTVPPVESDLADISTVAALGYHIPKRFDKILDIEHCYLQPSPSNEIRLFIKQYALEKGYEFYSTRVESRGGKHSNSEDNSRSNFSLRNIIIRNAGEKFMLILVVSKHNSKAIEDILNAVQGKFPQVVSLYYVVNEKVNDSISDLEAIHYSGEEFLTAEMPNFHSETLKTLKFRIAPKSFYQTNALQSERLYNVAAEMASLKQDDVVYDLYTGTGTIALFIANSVKKVVGIEYINEAVNDAKANAVSNNINNASFFAGDMAKILTQQFVEQNGKPDVIITDPPREGMHPDVVKTLLDIEAERIVYVSCNAATQARDIALLAEKYTLKRHRAVDMFPHTAHVESVALLTKNTL
ncbi:MAG: 23S rRNA (uracil(1939)-C(5))-methyltransferase RlmD [Bacteroidales bacterium]|jgi:23S rRNA (uracil1939-C5)-methyltransferase|nr:23S rRNA (uracil(1939)-C(5))-methyltransferase RlmD [Bacteroidales bacterium]